MVVIWVLLVCFLVLLLLWVMRLLSWFPALFSLLKKRLPHLSKAEQEALESGDVWWERSVFQGKLSWSEMLDFKPTELTQHEQLFLTEVVNPFCATLDNAFIEKEDDLPPAAWAVIREKGLWGLCLPKKYDGHGFSACALGAIIARIASRNVAAAITVMVPNTVGPAAFIAAYGTDKQKALLPRFVSGEWVGCFALTSALAGSDAAHLTDGGVVCYGVGEQSSVLGVTLSWDKRYITLAPCSDYLCLACSITDPAGLLPDSALQGISLVLVPTALSGVVVGHRHHPMTRGLMNGTTQGEHIWLPLTAVIGGEDALGKGWDMMMGELAAGRGLSLPSLGTALCQQAFRMTHIYANTRRQFSRKLIEFEGISHSYLRLAGFAFLSRSVQWFTIQGLCAGNRPAIASAIAKYHLTEMARESVNIAMDIHGGRAAQGGDRNYFSQMYQALPVMVTVEGANILTRHLIIFGQGLIRCHPFLGEEWQLLNKGQEKGRLKRFDRVFWRHVRSFLSNTVVLAGARVFGGLFFRVPKDVPHRRELAVFLRLSRALMWLTDVNLLRFGGQLKEHERIAALLGDVMSYLYMMLSVCFYERNHEGSEAVMGGVQWSIAYCLKKAQLALIELVQALPSPVLRWLVRCIVFPARLVYHQMSAFSGAEWLDELMRNPCALNDLTPDCFRSDNAKDATGRMEYWINLSVQVQPVLNKLSNGEKSLPIRNDWRDLLQCAEVASLSSDEKTLLEAFVAACHDVIQVD